MEFAEEMERTMEEHDEKKGVSWKTCSELFLWDKLDEEWKELNHSYLDELRREELIDITNICMMLWHRLRNKL